MKRSKKALLIALVIGDGYIRLDTRRKNACASLCLCHSKKQEEYLNYKVDLLHSLLGGKRPVVRQQLSSVQRNGLRYPQVASDKAHKYFKILRRWLYPNKYAYLKYLTPHALAIWYMDDGSIIANNRYPDGSCSSCRTNIHTGCKSREDAQVICDYFKDTWDIKFTPFNEKGTYSVRCFHKEGKKFHELIHQYIIPSMEYKQRFYYTRAHSPLEDKGDDIVSSHGKKDHEVIDIKNYNIR